MEVFKSKLGKEQLSPCGPKEIHDDPGEVSI